MSHTTPSPVELVLVVDVEELELSAADPVEDDPAVESPDSAGAVEMPGCVTPPKLEAPPPPPQAERTHASARRWTTRMQVSLADSLIEVTRRFMAVAVG